MRKLTKPLCKIGQITSLILQRVIFKYENKLGDRRIKQLLNLDTAKYRDFSVSRRSIIVLSPIIYVLAIAKLRYFAQTMPIIVYYLRYIRYRNRYCASVNKNAHRNS